MFPLYKYLIIDDLFGVNDFCLFQVLDVSSVQLVYNNSHFKSLATGGNVSQALVCVKVKVSKHIS